MEQVAHVKSAPRELSDANLPSSPADCNQSAANKGKEEDAELGMGPSSLVLIDDANTNPPDIYWI